MRTVGILGGMGPEATVLLMSRLIAATPAQDDADHIPLIVDQNTQVPSRIAALLGGSDADPAPVLAAMARRLQAAGAQALAMPCNTAHHFAPAIQAASSLPFLDMIALSATRADAVALPGAAIGIIASPAVQRTQLLDRALHALGRSTAYPADQAALLTAIRAIKAGRADQARPALLTASADLLAQGVAIQLIACSEFSMVPDCAAAGACQIDTLDVLVDAIRSFATAPA